MHVDLNLARAFDALLVEKNVTRAAKKLGIGQPAMSHALARLREIANDALLVRVGANMVPTPRALEIAPMVRAALADLERAFAPPRAFDPETSHATFVIGATDYALYVLLPTIVANIARVAPHVNLDVRTLGAAQPSLASGDIDLALGPDPRESGEGLYRQRLFDERFVCLVRKGHPLTKGKRTPERFVSFPHALVAPRGATRGGIVDEELGKIGRKRRVSVTIPHFLVAPHVVSATDLVLTIAERVARPHVGWLGLASFEPPLRVPGFTVYQIWHARRHDDPAHRWLREIVTTSSHESAST